MNLTPSRALSVAATLLVLAAAGCTDPTVAPKSTVSGADIWSDQNSYTEYMAKLYGGLILTSQNGPNENCDKCGDIRGIDEGFSEYLRLFWYMQEATTDEAVIGWGDAGLYDLNANTWDANNSMIMAMYARVYFQTVLANEFLRQTTLDLLNSRGVGTQLKTTIQQYRAEARFLRALAYAHGLDFFGRIPLVTEADPINGPFPMQVSRDSMYHYVVNELISLRDSLPLPGAATYPRATKSAANMLLASLYLNAAVYTGTPHYDLAQSTAQTVIASGPYSLDTTYIFNFMSDNNTSPEIIFAAAQDGTHSQTWGGMTFLVHAECGGSLNANTFGMDYCWGGYRLRQQVARSYYTPGDARTAFFTANGTSDSVVSIGSYTGTLAPKFSNKTSSGGSGEQQTMIDTDFPIFRLAEAYLIRAEAAMRLAGGAATAAAVADINTLRHRAFGNAAHDASVVTFNMDSLLVERGRELLYEGKRRTDLIRFGKYIGVNYLWAWKGGNSAGGSALLPRDTIFPIPTNELTTNPNIVQNGGY